MRAVFLLTILLVAALYTTFAFTDLSFLSSTGRLGPGFFPRIIGSALVIACLGSLFVDIKQGRLRAEGSPFWLTIALVGLLSFALILMLNVLGGLLAMVLFLFGSLSLLNRGRLTQNALIALLLPLGIYALFDLWLNAAMPEGLIPFPV